MSDEAKTNPTEEPRIEKLSNYITELLQSIKELGNDIPKDLLDVVEGAAKNIVIAKNENEQRIKESKKKQQVSAEEKEASEKDKLCGKVLEIFESAMEAELKTFDLLNKGAVSEGSQSRTCIAERKVIQDINERILKDTPYVLCKYFREISTLITYPFRGGAPVGIDGKGIMLARKDKVHMYVNYGFDAESLHELAKKKCEDLSVQDCINVAKYTGAPENTETLTHLLDHLARLGVLRVGTCKKTKTSKPIKVKKADIIKVYKELIDRMTAVKSRLIENDVEIVD